ncbi:MAG: GNAT family N-acetyltransferase [Myxococcota bacterium]|nr:GNAT family N-acetyltransferase [Myxococcota bacterium]
MNLTYRDVRFDHEQDCELLARWNNDPAVKHLYHRFEDAQSLARDFSVSYFQRLVENAPGEPGRTLMVLSDGIPIGQATLEMDPLKLLTRAPRTGWIALLIGESRLRGSGLGHRIVAHLEGLAAHAGAERIEVGIFEFNEPALGLFTKLGYEPFARRPDRTWWNGRRWAEVRMLKQL